MQSTVPELIAGLCPVEAEIELYNEKEADIPLDRYWDLVFFSYLHSFYEHTKVLSVYFRNQGMVTIAGGRHASYFAEDCMVYFDSVVVGEPEPNIPPLIGDYKRSRLKKIYNNPPVDPCEIRPSRYDLIDFGTNPNRLPGIEASRGCPFACSFCVLTGREKYRYRPVSNVIGEIEYKIRWNGNLHGMMGNAFVFQDNNLGGSPRYLRELCQALIPLRKIWGCAVAFGILRDRELVRLMGKAGCRFVYTGIESLNPESLQSMNKGHQQIQELREIIKRAYSSGIMLSFGLIVGADGDTNEYFEGLPGLLSDMKCFSITYVGILCPYPGTPLYAQLKKEGRILPGTSIRDYDGYTLCHRPTSIGQSELVEHFKNLCECLGSRTNAAKQFWGRLFMSSLPRYKLSLLFGSRESRSLRTPVSNHERTYIGGIDQIEEWDRKKMKDLGIPMQIIS